MAGDNELDNDGMRDLSISRGYQPPPMPPRAPDGGPVLTPAPIFEVTPDGQGLCAGAPAGPCRNYHRMVTSVDAQRAIAKVVGETDDHLELGELGPGDDDSQPLAQQVIHTCYPAPGVEIDLTGHHVFACNRYTPRAMADLIPAAELGPPSLPPRAEPRSARAPKKRRSGRRK